MRLRKLEIKDAPYMLEWMHDSDVIRYMKKDFSAMTIEDCASFIKSCGDEHENIIFGQFRDGSVCGHPGG